MIFLQQQEHNVASAHVFPMPEEQKNTAKVYISLARVMLFTPTGENTPISHIPQQNMFIGWWPAPNSHH